MATEEQAQKEIVAALCALRVILTQRPRREYPGGLEHHPEVKKLQAEIERTRSPHSATLDPRGPYFRDFIRCDVLPLTELPADWETLKWLDHYIERFGGEQDEHDEQVLLTVAERRFGFKPSKALPCLLDRHPGVKTGRPLTKTGKPHPRRRTVSVLGLARAISKDDKIISDPARRARMEGRLKKAQLSN